MASCAPRSRHVRLVLYRDRLRRAARRRVRLRHQRRYHHAGALSGALNDSGKLPTTDADARTFPSSSVAFTSSRVVGASADSGADTTTDTIAFDRSDDAFAGAGECVTRTDRDTCSDARSDTGADTGTDPSANASAITVAVADGRSNRSTDAGADSIADPVPVGYDVCARAGRIQERDSAKQRGDADVHALSAVVGGVVATVLAGAVFVYAKTARRQSDAMKINDVDVVPINGGAGGGTMNNVRGSGQYRSLSPARPPANQPTYDAYPNPYAVAGGAAGTAKFSSDSMDQINLNDPAFDVLTPLSDIAMVSTHESSFDGYYPSQTSSSNAAPLSELYPSDILASSRVNNVSGDSDSDSDENSSSFGSSHSGFDMPSASEWDARDTQRPPSEASSSGHSVVDGGACSVNYSEFSTDFSEYEVRDTNTSDFDAMTHERFDSHVFSDDDNDDVDIDIDSDDDIANETRQDVRNTGAEFHDDEGSSIYSSSYDFDVDDDDESGYGYGTESFSSDSGVEV